MEWAEACSSVRIFKTEFVSKKVMLGNHTQAEFNKGLRTV